MTMMMVMVAMSAAGDFECLQSQLNVICGATCRDIARQSASVGSEKLPSTYMVMFWPRKERRRGHLIRKTVCHKFVMTQLAAPEFTAMRKTLWRSVLL